MAKQLKFWNGRGHGIYNNKHINVAAYSQRQASELVGTACDLGFPLGINEIKTFYSPMWGTAMNEIKPTITEPCVYVDERFGNTPKKVL